MARGLNEEQAAVDTGILDVALTLSSEFLAEVGRVLILDIFDNGVPAGFQVSLTILFARKQANSIPSVIVDLVTVARCIHDVQTETDTIFLDDWPARQQ